MRKLITDFLHRSCNKTVKARQVHPDVQKSGQLGRQVVGCWLGLIPVAHPETMKTSGQLVVPAVAT